LFYESVTKQCTVGFAVRLLKNGEAIFEIMKYFILKVSNFAFGEGIYLKY